MLYEVWSEGYRTNRESSCANYFGKFEGKTFRDAVKYLRDTIDKESRSYIDMRTLTFWGCRFFDNETDARKLFG